MLSNLSVVHFVLEIAPSDLTTCGGGEGRGGIENQDSARKLTGVPSHWEFVRTMLMSGFLFL